MMSISSDIHNAGKKTTHTKQAHAAPLLDELLQHAQQDVSVEAALVSLIKDQAGVLPQLRVL